MSPTIPSDCYKHRANLGYKESTGSDLKNTFIDFCIVIVQQHFCFLKCDAFSLFRGQISQMSIMGKVESFPFQDNR